MKTRRLIIEMVLGVLCLGLLGWQRMTIGALRRERSEVAANQAPPARVSAPPESVRRDASVGGSRSTGAPPRSMPRPAATDLAGLQAENRALREQNEALVTQQQQARYSSELIAADRGVSEMLLTSIAADPTRPPDTTGVLPTGEAASWSHRQVIGAPDTPEAGDVVTAWASRNPDGGEEWLQLRYGQPVDIAQINVHETYNPGAISRITALLPDGSEKTLWEGTEPPEQAPVEVGFPVPPGVRSDQIKVYMDTARVPGWNEVDAVELVGSDGSRQWASSSSASSYYGDRRR